MIDRWKSGFTLIEMLIVVAIIAVLAAIIIPTVTGNIEQSREATDLANIRNAMAEIAIVSMSGDCSEANEVTYDGTNNYYHKYVYSSQKMAKWQSYENSDSVIINGTSIKATANNRTVDYWDIKYMVSDAEFVVTVY